jgi:hypothetical protein
LGAPPEGNFPSELGLGSASWGVVVQIRLGTATRGPLRETLSVRPDDLDENALDRIKKPVTGGTRVEDPKLEANIARVQELITIWQEYYQLLLASFDKAKDLPPDAEERFQRVKNVVAERHDQFSEVITKDHYVAQNILQMVKRTISIFDFEKSSEVAVDKTVIEWHEANLLLFETLGSLEYERHRISKISENEQKKQDAANKRAERIDKIRANKTLFAILKYGLIIGFILGLWFSPLRPWFASIPFVHKRINEFREIVGKEPLPDPSGSGEEPAGDEE